VLALFSTVGTNGSLAVRPVANAAKVPQLFADAPASVLGLEYRRFPYTLGYTPTGSAVGQAFARYLLATSAARAKVGVLYEDDEEGRDLLAGLEKGLGAGKGKIVGTAPVDPAATDVEAGVAELQATGANTLMVFVPGAHATQAYQSAARLGWKPKLYVRDPASAPPEGSISSAFARDIASPAFADDPGASLARAIVKRFVPGASPRDASLVAGMASAFTMVDALRRAGKNPTRESLMRAAASLAEANNPFLLPGIVVRTARASRFPITQVRLQLRHAGRWQPLGGLVSVKP
jgi:ABC-type branched-subunit amino acid transport system substrate-binding protein